MEKNVMKEHLYIQKNICSCGGRWRKKIVSTDRTGTAILCQCQACGVEKRFDFIY